MSRLTRSDGRPAGPVRVVHLGLGNFCRAHTCWYTDQAGDADDWGVAGFAGRSDTHVVDLRAQDGLYTLLVQGPSPTAQVISALSAVHAAAELGAWRGYFASSDVVLVTSTITEAGYLCRPDGALDLAAPAVAADLAGLRRDPLGAVVTSAPGKFVAGLLARRQAEAGPITVVPCDNVVASGALARRVITELAQAVDPSLVRWIDDQVGFVSTMVDRITPAPSPADVGLAAALTGHQDPAVVVTEPFTEWVLGAGFRTPHPDWSAAGATLVDDVGPFEQRKLWLLNGAHSLMAYAGALRGHATVQQAIADPVVADWVEQWWDQACRHLPLEPDDLARYRAALRLRFANPALRDALGRIGADGSQKIPIRWVPAIRADLAAGRTAEAGLRGVAGWVWHLRGATGSVTDTRQAEVVDLGRGPLAEAVAAVLAFLGLPAELTGEVVRLARQLRITAPV